MPITTTIKLVERLIHHIVQPQIQNEDRIATGRIIEEFMGRTPTEDEIEYCMQPSDHPLRQ